MVALFSGRSRTFLSGQAASERVCMCSRLLVA